MLRRSHNPFLPSPLFCDTFFFFFPSFVLFSLVFASIYLTILYVLYCTVLLNFSVYFLSITVHFFADVMRDMQRSACLLCVLPRSCGLFMFSVGLYRYGSRSVVCCLLVG